MASPKQQIRRARDEVASRLFGDRFQPGLRVGRYAVVEMIGGGGMGRVYRARDTELDRDVALKRLHTRAAGDDRARLVREAQAMAKFSHPNIVPVYDVALHDDELVIAMEHVPGETLDAWLETPRSWSDIVATFVQAGRGLAAAHAAGVVHRDFKPSNVLLSDAGAVKVADFGLARGADITESDGPGSGVSSGMLSSPLTQDGTVLGTPAFMAPEQHVGKAADPLSDQYAFCVALWRALYGRPFVAKSLSDLAAAKHAGPPSIPSGTRVPTRIGRLLQRGMATRPQDRFASMDVLLEALERAPSRRAWWIVAAAAAAIAGVLAVGVRTKPQKVDTPVVSAVLPVMSDPAVAEIFALERAGRYELAVSKARVAVEQAEDPQGRARAQLALGTVLWNAGSFDEARGELQSAFFAAEKGGDEETAMRASLELAKAYATFRMEPQEASTWANHAEAALERFVAAPQELEALLASVRGAIAATEGRLDEALVEHERALEILVAAGGEDHPEIGSSLLDIGQVQWALGRYAEARSTLERARDLLGAQYGESHPDLASAWADLGTVAYAQGEIEEADAHYRRALAIAEATLPAQHVLVATAHNNLGTTSLALHRSGEAVEHLEKALAIWERLSGADHPDVAAYHSNLAMARAETGDVDGAIDHLVRALAILETARGPGDPTVATIHANLGVTYFRAGRPEDARREHEQALAIRLATLGEDHPDVAASREALDAIRDAGGKVR